MKKYLLAIDQGTTSTRAILFTQDGEQLASSQLPLQQYFPQTGWVEHDAEEIFQATITVCRNVLAETQIDVNEIAGIGITNQRETTVIWDRTTGKPLYHAIVWQDRRTADYCEDIKKNNIAKEITAITGLVVDPYFSATKIHWLLNNVPNAKSQAHSGQLAVGTIDSYLLWRLTGGKVHATDVTNASRTLLFNLHTRQWDQELLRLFEIPAAILPEIHDNCSDFGVTETKLFGTEIPIVAMAGDQQAALFGQACFKPGMIKSTFGTGCFLLMNTGNKITTSKHKLLTTMAYQIAGKPTYAIEGSIFAGGTTVQWLRDELGIIKNSAESEKFASQLHDNGGVYLVPAFTGLGAPYWDPYARGAILGLTRGSSAAHIIRAGLEAIAYQTRDLIEVMMADSGDKPTEMRVDGGMVANNWLLQFLADLLHVTVLRPTNIESTARGVAMMAGLQLGFYSDLEQLSKLWQLDKKFAPDLKSDKEKEYKGWLQAVEKVMSSAS